MKALPLGARTIWERSSIKARSRARQGEILRRHLEWQVLILKERPTRQTMTVI